MTDELDRLNDAALSEVFAVEVAGRRKRLYRHGKYTVPHFGWDGQSHDVHSYATDFSLVFPYLERVKAWSVEHIRKKIFILVHHTASGAGEARTLPRAACLALIRATRAARKKP